MPTDGTPPSSIINLHHATKAGPGNDLALGVAAQTDH
jgi:hypothetical protein